MISSLFRKPISSDLLVQLIRTIGINTLHDEFTFSKKEIEYHNTIDKIIEMKPLLEEYYLPCKSKKYLENINIRKVVTILKHFFGAFNYRVTSREKYCNGKKYILYIFMYHDDNIYNLGGKSIIFDS